MAEAYRLVDVLKRARASSKFYVPSETERDSLCRGDFAKLIFNDEERMWVLVTAVLGRGRYKGELRNHPVAVPLRYGDEISFESRHIADTYLYN